LTRNEGRLKQFRHEVLRMRLQPLHRVLDLLVQALSELLPNLLQLGAMRLPIVFRYTMKYPVV
jgi:hypothetical protein